MNTKIYKSVHNLAEKLLLAAKKEDQKKFDSLYAELNTICISNENSSKDHPVQWETLADFTEELADAIAIYEKALAKATEKNLKDYIASIAFSIATLQVELGLKEKALKNLQIAKKNTTKSEDKEFQLEINNLLKTLT